MMRKNGRNPLAEGVYTCSQLFWHREINEKLIGMEVKDRLFLNRKLKSKQSKKQAIVR
jgi:hypothetical protein